MPKLIVSINKNKNKKIAQTINNEVEINNISSSGSFVEGPYIITSVTGNQIRAINPKNNEEIEFSYEPGELTQVGPNKYRFTNNLMGTEFDEKVSKSILVNRRFKKSQFSPDMNEQSDPMMNTQPQQQRKPYSLTLTEEEMSDIWFVGHRYSWSDALSNLEVGVNELAEHEAWNLKDAFEADTEGGHSYFPMLNPNSELYEKLINFMDQIV